MFFTLKLQMILLLDKLQSICDIRSFFWCLGIDSWYKNSLYKVEFLLETLIAKQTCYVVSSVWIYPKTEFFLYFFIQLNIYLFFDLLVLAIMVLTFYFVKSVWTFSDSISITNWKGTKFA